MSSVKNSFLFHLLQKDLSAMMRFFETNKQLRAESLSGMKMVYLMLESPRILNME